MRVRLSSSYPSVPIPLPPDPEDRGNGKRDKKRRQRRSSRGGWPSSPSLTWNEVKQISALAHETQRRGFKFTHLITIMPNAGDDMKRKRECVRIIGHLGQALKRHDKQHVGVTVYEKSDGADLHAHHLVHMPSGEHDLVERLHNPPKIDVRRAVPAHIDYITKQRRPLPPEFEAHVKHRRQKGGLRIPGRRWSATSSARALLDHQPTTDNSRFKVSAHVPPQTRAGILQPVGDVR